MREISRVRDYLGNNFGEVFVLHSEVSKDEQEAALSPLQARKINSIDQYR